MKTFMKVMAAMAAIAAAAVVLYHFRDKLKALCPCCRTRGYESDFEPCCCASDEAAVEQVSVEKAEKDDVQETKATSEDFAD